jgi:hypothetical protein
MTCLKSARPRRVRDDARVIELFAVAPDEDADFLAAWAAEAEPGATLYRALRADVRLRFAALAAGVQDATGGVLLIAAFDVAAGEDERFLPAWEAVRARLATRQGYLGARRLASPDGRVVVVVYWSSPLMYARTVRAEGDLVGGLAFRGEAALYAFQRRR